MALLKYTQKFTVDCPWFSSELGFCPMIVAGGGKIKERETHCLDKNFGARAAESLTNSIPMSEAPSAPPHPRGLPSVLFIEDEEAFLVKTGFTEEAAALEMRAAFQQLQSMASNLRGKRTSLESKLPETSKALAMVAQLKTKRQKKETARVTYELIGGVYCAADVAPSDKVMLWLGANVMVEYSLDEAETFLSKQLSDATEALQTTKEDIAHLDDQINTLEVNINRMHNHAMAKRRSKPVGAVK